MIWLKSLVFGTIIGFLCFVAGTFWDVGELVVGAFPATVTMVLGAGLHDPKLVFGSGRYSIPTSSYVVMGAVFWGAFAAFVAFWWFRRLEQETLSPGA